MPRYFLAVFLLVLMPQPAEADMAAGLAAYDAGNYATARRAWLKCAGTGNTDAHTALAGLYAQGAGVAQDQTRAAEWYRRAAIAGDAIGQLNIGDMRAQGIGVARDLPVAWVWLSLAAQQGNDWARDRRDAVHRDMSPVMRREAAVLLKTWQR